MVQSRLQYNLAYGGQPSAIAALYPQMMHMISPSAFQGFDPQSAAAGQSDSTNVSGGSVNPMGFSPNSDQYTPNGTAYSIASMNSYASSFDR